MNRPSTFVISVFLLLLLAVTAVVTLIAYSPTFNRPLTRMLTMMDLVEAVLPEQEPHTLLGQSSFEASSPEESFFRHPHGLVVDHSLSPDLLWVADTDNHRVLGFLLSETVEPDSDPDFLRGQPDMMTRSPAAGRAGLNEPIAVATDANGGLYIADLGNSRVVFHRRSFGENPNADWLFGQPNWDSTAPNNGGIGPASLNLPGGVALDADGNLYIADTGNNRVLRIPGGANGDGTSDRVWGQGGSFHSGVENIDGTVSARSLSRPLGIAIGPNAILAVADTGNHRVLLFDTNSEEEDAIIVLGQHGDFGTGIPNREGVSAYTLSAPHAIAFGPSGLFVADTDNHRVLHFERVESRRASNVWGQRGQFNDVASPDAGPTRGNFAHPSGIAFDSDGNLYVADRDHHRVVVFNR